MEQIFETLSHRSVQLINDCSTF